MERGGVDETRAETIMRRLRTIPSRALGLVVVTMLLPVLLVVAVMTDALRRVACGVPPTAVHGWSCSSGCTSPPRLRASPRWRRCGSRASAVGAARGCVR